MLKALVALVFAGCISPGEKRQIKDDVYDMQSRLLKLEQGLKETSTETQSQGESRNKQIAGTQQTLDKMQMDMQKIKGELDTLRFGVTTGRLPGQQPGQGSIADSLDEIFERLVAIEKSQEELVETIRKAGRKPVRRKPKPAARVRAKSVTQLQKSFDKKEFKNVSTDAPSLLAKTKGNEKHQVLFLLAESLFRIGKKSDAALKFNDLIDGKPSQNLLLRSKIRMGDCFRDLGDTATARLYYEELVADFPGSKEAADAKTRLAKLGN